MVIWRASDQESNQESNLDILFTEKQRDILDFCSVPRSAQEIMDRLGLSNQSKNRRKYIGALLEAGVLQMTVPDVPNSRTQKYIAVKVKC